MLFRAVQNIDPSVNAVNFESFNSYLQIIKETDSSLLNLLQTADYKLNNRIVDHVLVRAPLAAYEGSTAGDDIVLKWNNHSYINIQGDTVDVQPFDGEFNGIDNNFITGTLFVENFVNVPAVGETISSVVASVLLFMFNNLNDLVVYVSDVMESSICSLFVGSYELVTI